MIQQETFGQTPAGETVQRFTLVNDNGLRAELSDFGALLLSLCVPDRAGRLGDITLGYDTLAGWMGDRAYMGATVGRYGNRIARGRFTLDGKTYALAANNGPNHLHGGVRGFNKVMWAAKTSAGEDGPAVEFRYVSLDGEEGYPGTLTTAVRYTLTPANELRVEFRAVTDQPTVVNLVHHSYWNLTADPRRAILNHELMLAADQYLPVDAGAIPTGELAPVAGTPMDFTKAMAIGIRIEQVAGGYDHNWILRGPAGQVRTAARLADPSSGRAMELLTDQPGIQFYTGNFLDDLIRGKGGLPYHRHGGLCLETQRWPDSPNRPKFPSAVLRPGETYTHTMVHRFSAE